MADKELIKDGHTVSNVYAAGNNIGWICKGGETIWRDQDLKQVQNAVNWQNDGHYVYVTFLESSKTVAYLRIVCTGNLIIGVQNKLTGKIINMHMSTEDSSYVYESDEPVPTGLAQFTILCQYGPTPATIFATRVCWDPNP